MRRRTVAWTALVAGALWAAPAQADVLHLTNGNQIRCVVLRQDDTSVTVRLGPRMTMRFARWEIARIERESTEAHTALRSDWKSMSAPHPPARRTAPADALRDDSREADELAEWIEDDPTPEADELRDRDEAIRAYDFLPEHDPPAAIAAEFGEPQSKSTGRTPDGKPYEDWAYDVSGGNVRVVRFIEGRRGYFAASQSLRSAAPPPATTKRAAVPSAPPTAAEPAAAEPTTSAPANAETADAPNAD